MALSDHVSLTLTLEAVGIPRAGFGLPMIPSHNAPWSDRIRYYTQVSGATSDGFASDSPEVRALRAMFAQVPRPARAAIGRVTAPVTQEYTIHAPAARSSEQYKITAQGEGFEDATATYTSGASATVAQVHSGLVTALNAVADKNYTAALAALVVPDFTFTADNATEIFSKATHGFVTGDGPLRLHTIGTIVCDTNAAAADGDTVTVNDGTTTTIFEYDKAANGVGGGHVSWAAGTTAASNATALKLLIAAAYPAFVITDDLAGTLTLEAPGNVTLSRSGGVTVSVTSGALPTGTLPATDYWVIRIDADTYYLATSLALALAGTHLSISTNGTGTLRASDTGSTASAAAPFKVTGNAPGDWFSLAVYNVAALTNSQTHTVSGLSDDLDAILSESDGAFYDVCPLYNSPDYLSDTASWVETNGRIMIADSCDSEAVTTAYVANTSTDGPAVVFALGVARSMIAYHPRPAAMLAASWTGRWLSTDPGKSNPKFKTLALVETVQVTDTHRANLIARRANTYQTVGGRGITWEGMVPSTTNLFMDVTRNLDWLSDEVVSSVYEDLAGEEIVPYDEAGLLLVDNAIGGALQRGIRQGVLAPTPVPVVVMPELADISDSDKANRILRDAQFSGTLAGAVNHIDLVGSLSF